VRGFEGEVLAVNPGAAGKIDIRQGASVSGRPDFGGGPISAKREPSTLRSLSLPGDFNESPRLAWNW
jgi:hypothetical protein